VAVANGVIAYNGPDSHVDATILVTDATGRAPEVLVDLDASASMRLVLTCGGGIFLDEWTPDGSRLLFSHAIGGCETTVGHVAADGSDLRMIAFGTAPAWRPDGGLIAYGEPMPWQPCGRMCGPDVEDGPWRLLAAPPDGDPTVLTEGEPWTSTSDAAWSPDRRSLAFVRFTVPDGEDWAETGGTTELWLADGDGANGRRLVADAQAPFWSPDGRWIYFGRSDPETAESVVWRIRPDGTGEGRVAVGWMTRFSPDGLVLAVATETGVVAMNPDGSGATLLIPGTVVDGFDWAPDGAGIVAAVDYARDHGLYRTSLDGDVVAITGLGVDGQGPRWQPVLLDRPLGN
jgi:Tol biopolymer transport system component